MTESYDTPPPSGHEPDTTNVRGVALTALGLAVGIALTIVGISWFQHGFRPIAERLSAISSTPAPEDETTRIVHWQNPHEDLALIREREAQRLNGYGWVDRNAGVVRIPIDRAMALMADRAAPAAPDNGPSPSPRDGGTNP